MIWSTSYHTIRMQEFTYQMLYQQIHHDLLNQFQFLKWKNRLHKEVMLIWVIEFSLQMYDIFEGDPY